MGEFPINQAFLLIASFPDAKFGRWFELFNAPINDIRGRIVHFLNYCFCFVAKRTPDSIKFTISRRVSWLIKDVEMSTYCDISLKRDTSATNASRDKYPEALPAL